MIMCMRQEEKIVSQYSRELKRLQELANQQQIALDEAQRILYSTHIQIAYIQSLMWEEKTGIKLGSELAATSSFMKEIDVRRGAPKLAFRGWDWSARYTLHNVDVKDGREITAGVLCDAGGYTGMIPEWIIVEMHQIWLEKNPQLE